MTHPVCSLIVGLPADFIERHGRLRFACFILEKRDDRWHLRAVQPSRELSTLDLYSLEERPIADGEWVLAHVRETDEWVQARLSL